MGRRKKGGPPQPDKKQVKIYIEGEGGGKEGARRKHLDGEFRRCWTQFLGELKPNKGCGFQVVAGGGGGQTVDDMLNGQRKSGFRELRVALIDSERTVADISKSWAAVEMQKPDGYEDHHLFLMVQCLESWLLADVDGVAKYFHSKGRTFRKSKVPKWPNAEQQPKGEIFKALEAATDGGWTSKQHAEANQIIAMVSVERLKDLSSVQRLFSVMETQIKTFLES